MNVTAKDRARGKSASVILRRILMQPIEKVIGLIGQRTDLAGRHIHSADSSALSKLGRVRGRYGINEHHFRLCLAAIR